MRGRRPTPSHLKLITGNAGNRPVEADLEIKPGDDGVMTPARPAFLTGYAAEEWDRIVPHLERARLLTQIDHAALEGYCVAYGKFRYAEQRITEAASAEADKPREDGFVGAGLIVKAQNGFEQLSQWEIMSRRAQEQMKVYLVEFGMTPSARTRVKALGAQLPLLPGDDPMEGVLGASAHAGGR